MGFWSLLSPVDSCWNGQGTDYWKTGNLRKAGNFRKAVKQDVVEDMLAMLGTDVSPADLVAVYPWAKK
jgi:hypothetical protein